MNEYKDTFLNRHKKIICSILLLFFYPFFAWTIIEINLLEGSHNIFPIWLPAGIGLLYLIHTHPWRDAIFVFFIVAFLTNFFILENPFYTSLAIGAGNTLGAWIGYRLIYPIIRKNIFASVDLTQNYLLSLLLGATAASIVGNGALYLSGLQPIEQLTQSAIGYLVSDFLGMIMLTSVYIAFYSNSLKDKLNYLKNPLFWVNTLLCNMFAYFLLTSSYLLHVEFFILMPLLIILLKYREVGIYINGLSLFIIGIYTIILNNDTSYSNNTYTILDMQTFIFFTYVAGYIFSATLNQAKSLLKAQEKANEETLITFAHFIEEKDAYTAGHSNRVAQYATEIAKKMSLPKEKLELIYKAGLIHDIGKIDTPESVLLNPSHLSEDEYNLMKQHASVGSDMIKRISHFKPHSRIVRHHHEWYDGNGYPDGLKGKNIPLLSRILCVADAFDAMTTNRIYKPRKSIPEAIEELEQMSGKQFDPNVIFHAKKYFNTLESIDAYEQDVARFSSQAEEKRFAYFFKDSLTGLYNKDYFHIILNQKFGKLLYKNLYAICLKGTGAYNEKYGWNEGDKLLKKFSGFLENNFSEALFFRVYGDDFLILQKHSYPINEKNLELFEPIKNGQISIKITHIDLGETPLRNAEELESHLFSRNKTP